MERRRLLMGTGGFDGGDRDGEKLIGLLQQIKQETSLNISGFNEKLHPIHAFIAFLLNDAHFGDEIPARLCSASRAVICTHGGATAQQLFADDLGGSILGQTFAKANHSKSKSSGSSLQIL